MRVLFVCSANLDRSPTAEALFGALPGVEARSAGTLATAARPLDAEIVAWADAIFAMEEKHAAALRERFGDLLQGKAPVVLDVPDVYRRGDPALVDLLRRKLGGRL